MVFSYKLGCRDCLKTDGVNRISIMADAEFEEYELMTENEVALLIEEWRENAGNECKFCGGINEEVLEVKIDDYFLYDFDRLVKECISKGGFMLNLSIDKSIFDITFNPGGSPYLPTYFVEEALIQLINKIETFPESKFIPKDIGNCFFCLSGNGEIKLQRFRSAGFSKKAIILCIKQFANQKYAIDL